MLLARVPGQPFGTLVGAVCGRSERVCAVALLAALVALVPLAHASPADPLWIVGIYDAADSDDVVLVVTALEHSVESDLLTVILVLILAAVPLRAGPVGPDAIRGSIQARAPPGKS